MAYFAAFEKHYYNLEEALPANLMLSTFISKGLLGDTLLLQSVASENTDSGKTRRLLESMRGGLKIGETKTFEKFLEAMCEYADRNNDLVVKKLVEDVYKDLPGKQRPVYEPPNPSNWLTTAVLAGTVGIVLYCLLQGDLFDDKKLEMNPWKQIYIILLFMFSAVTILVVVISKIA